MDTWKRYVTDEESDELVEIYKARKAGVRQAKKIRDRAYQRMVRSEGKK